MPTRDRFACGCHYRKNKGIRIWSYCPGHAPEPADRQYLVNATIWGRQSGKTAKLTGLPGIVGMLDSGRSDLSVNAKRIARGQPLLDGLECGDQRHQDPEEQTGRQ